MNKLNKYFLVKLLIIGTIFSAPLFSSSLGLTTGVREAQASAETDIWWPTNGADLSGKHPFKALIKNGDIKEYDMYWQVDGGQLNKMDDNYTDYPHKETTVDLSGWHWRENGEYTINFISKNKNGSIISEEKVEVNVNKKQDVSPESDKASNTSDESSETDPVKNSDENNKNTSPILGPVPEVIATKPSPSPTPTPSPVKPTEMVTEVWWPINNVTVNGNQPFKALVKDMNLSDYKMYWQVDGDRLNEMHNSYTDHPHKEVLVNLSNWNWKGSGPYTITFIAKDNNGKEISKKSIVINTGNAISEEPEKEVVVPETEITHPTDVEAKPTTPSTPPVDETVDETPIVTVPNTNNSNPFAGEKFYVNPNNNALRQALLWKDSRPEDAKLMEKIANMPDAKWIGNWNTDVYNDVKKYVNEASSAGAIPVMIAYNIPSRDCGSYSAGGAADAKDYKAWIRSFADGIGNKKAVIILEPDALPGITCLDQAGQNSRMELLNDAIEVFKSKGNTSVYVDAGHSNWINVNDMAERLKKAGIAKADGFALNVSNYNWTNDQINYGTQLSSLVGGKHFIVDTSRNGKGPNGSEWCNPRGRGLGRPATTNTGNPLVDAFMWLKNPGESDGTCNGGPSAGVWWPEYALELAKNAEF